VLQGSAERTTQTDNIVAFDTSPPGLVLLGPYSHYIIPGEWPKEAPISGPDVLVKNLERCGDMGSSAEEESRQSLEEKDRIRAYQEGKRLPFQPLSMTEPLRNVVKVPQDHPLRDCVDLSRGEVEKRRR